MAEDVHPGQVVRGKRGQGGEYDPGRPEDDGQRPRGGDADTERTRRLVPGAGGHGNPVPRLARHRRRLECAGKPARGQVEGGQDLPAPAAAGDVEEERAARVGDVDRPLSR